MARRLVIHAREMIEQRGLDVEIEEQVEDLLQRIDQFRFVARGIAILPQSVKIVLELREIPHVLAGDERLHGKWKRRRALRLEAPEIGEIGVDAPCGE